MELKETTFYVSKICSNNFNNTFINNCNFIKSDLEYNIYNNCIIENVKFNRVFFYEQNFSNTK